MSDLIKMVSDFFDAVVHVVTSIYEAITTLFVALSTIFTGITESIGFFPSFLGGLLIASFAVVFLLRIIGR